MNEVPLIELALYLLWLVYLFLRSLAHINFSIFREYLLRKKGPMRYLAAEKALRKRSSDFMSNTVPV